MRCGFLLLPACFAFFAGCDEPGPLGQPPQDGDVTLELLTTRPLLARPWGIALDPTGRYLVVSSYFERQLYVLDAETYQPVGDTIGAGKVRGIVFAPAGSASRMFVPGEASGLIEGEISPEGALTLELRLPEFAAVVAWNAAIGSLYAIMLSPERMLIRLASDGSILATRLLRTDGWPGLASTRDGETILTIEYNDPDDFEDVFNYLLALDADDLTLVAAVEIPFWALHVVPVDGGRAVVMGRGREALVDWENEIVLRARELNLDRPSEGFVDMGRGNPWVQVDSRTAIIGTSNGIFAVDTRTGGVSQVDGEFEDGARVNECCSMVWDAARARLVVASSVVVSEPNPHEAGRLEVYRIR